ncbi:hypothetical protein Tel_03880 [Candidatus Tenderia electrophaga]|jgi:hypothetical protein|uniref:Dynamin N-terminal domain-containing protein n=1 Tax=Candidatus Tenderia electrophaga TaxID=1748243 RepID=A0A0S2TB35_9GAMM|nr:hypothetical protein Tel_03880 [Candidatus Tenderia electrophaga]
MEEDLFKQQMRAFDRWKADLIQVIQDYHHWLESNGKGTADINVRLFDVIESLKSDQLTVAFVAEFSRGKTELINAIFFADYKRRLLPSEAGRTTMCPTELFYDHEVDQAYIRMLPIETRLQDTSISELKKDPDQWKTINLDVNSPDQMIEAMKQVVATKRVPLQDAMDLGLYSDDTPRRRRTDDPPPAEIEVPEWRHCMISFPHPLLQQGLAILDTPGLNALGTEPELTYNMLPNAHAVLFILAADTGVTRSDLDVWEYYIKQHRRSDDKGLVAALNKIDTLWDEMKSEDEVAASIEAQQREVANALSIDTGGVFPVSAQKALLAKTKEDQVLLEKSRLMDLERYLANEIIPAKQGLIRDNVVGEIGDLIKINRNSIATRYKQLKSQLNDLKSASGKNTTLIQHLMRKAREKQAAYNNNMEYFQSSRRTLNQQAKLLLNELSLKKFDNVAGTARKQMTDSWTTAGLKTGMKTLFDGIRDTMQVATRHADETHQQIISIYQKFEKETELQALDPKPFSTDKYDIEMQRLYDQAEEFRSSPVTTMTEQSFVVKKFFISLVSHARDIFFQANQEAETWFKDIMIPLAKHVTEHKQLLEQHMETLYKINESKDNIASKTAELEGQCRKLAEQYAALDGLLKKLQSPIGRAADDSNAQQAASG